MRWWIAISLFCVTWGPSFSQGRASAQGPGSAEPIVGLRDQRPQQFALTGGRVVIQPGRELDEATVLISGTSIREVGTNLAVPAGWKEIDCRGKTIYAGLIDAWSETDVDSSRSDAGHWNPHVTPERSSAKAAAGGVNDAKKLRSQGITVRVVAPRGGIVKGSSAAVLLGESIACSAF